MSHPFSTHGYPLSVSNGFDVVMNLWWYVQPSHGSLMIALHSGAEAKEFKAILHSIPSSKIMIHNATNNTTFLWGVILEEGRFICYTPKKLEEFLGFNLIYLIFI